MQYRPFRVGTCVAISFSLLGVLEERSFLSLLSLCGLIAEVGGGRLRVVIVISLCAASRRVYPPVSAIVSLLLCCGDNEGLIPQCAKWKRNEVQKVEICKNFSWVSHQAAATQSISAGP